MAFNPYQFPMTPVGPQSPASAAQDNAPTQYKGNPGGANNMPSQRPQFHPSGFPVNPSQPSVMPVQGQNGQRQPSMQAYDWTGANSGSQAPRPPTLFDMQRDYRNPQGQKPSPYNQQQNPIKPGMPVGDPPEGGMGARGSYEDLIRRMMDRFSSQQQPSYGGGNANFFGGQAQNVGRYRPPTMDASGNWADTQPYNYNLPNAHGSYSGYGQGNPNSPNFGFGYGGIYDPYAPRPPIPGGG